MYQHDKRNSNSKCDRDIREYSIRIYYVFSHLWQFSASESVRVLKHQITFCDLILFLYFHSASFWKSKPTERIFITFQKRLVCFENRKFIGNRIHVASTKSYIELYCCVKQKWMIYAAPWSIVSSRCCP